MNEQIAVTHSAFNLDFCNRCLELVPEHRGAAGPENDTHNVRRSNIAWVRGILRYPEIITPIVNHLHQVNKEFFNFDLEGIEDPQFTEYDSSEQGKYDPHRDDLILPNGMPRKLSMVIQLTPPDCYEGGELVFPNSPEYSADITKKQGTAIVFPSYLLHGVTPVTSGNRKSMVCWAHGPAFR